MPLFGSLFGIDQIINQLSLLTLRFSKAERAESCAGRLHAGRSATDTVRVMAVASLFEGQML